MLIRFRGHEVGKQGRSGRAIRHAAQLRQAKARKETSISSKSALPDYRRKLARADTHIREVERLANDWAKDNECYKIGMESESNGELILFGEQLKPLPNDLGLVIGDALQAMRSSLDNLAFALALKNKPELTDDDQLGVSFPVFDRPPLPSHKSVKHMERSVVDKVLGLCPDPEVGPINDHPLWLLNKTNNRDKHRVITVAAVAVDNFSHSLSGTVKGPSRIGIGGPKRTRNVGDRVVFSTFGPGSQVKVDVRALVQIVFGEGIEISDREVITTLRWFHDYIRETVFQTLEPYL